MTNEETLVREIIERCIDMSNKSVNNEKPFQISVGVSNRHIHLCRKDMEALFGVGYELQPMKDLVQVGEYAAKETLTLAGPKGSIEKVRVLGPLRSYTQVELLITDERKLGIKLPIRESGNQEPSPQLTLIGPKGAVTIEQGVLAAWRHIHLATADAEKLDLKNGDLVKVKSQGDRSVVLNNVKVRVGNFITEIHLDVDEANAANITNGSMVELQK